MDEIPSLSAKTLLGMRSLGLKVTLGVEGGGVGHRRPHETSIPKSLPAISRAAHAEGGGKASGIPVYEGERADGGGGTRPSLS